MTLGKRPSGTEPMILINKIRRLVAPSFLDVLEEMGDQSRTSVEERNAKTPVFAGVEQNLEFQVLDVCMLEDDRQERNVSFYISGCTKQGNPVIAHIRRFYPYFYVKAPEAIYEQDLKELVKSLNPLRVRRASFGNHEYLRIPTLGCKRAGSWLCCEGGSGTKPRITHGVTTESICYKPCDSLSLLQVVLSGGGFSFRGIAFTDGTTILCPKGDPLDMFLSESKLSCLSSWAVITANKYIMENSTSNVRRNSIEISVSYENLQVTSASSDALPFAPLRVLSMDIETKVPDELLPNARVAPVFQICCMVSTYGEETPFCRRIFAVQDVEPIKGVIIESFPNEYEMLKAWRHFFNDVDADVLVGHNVVLFDYPYLLKRLEILRLTNPSLEFARLPLALPRMKLEDRLPSDGFRWEACYLPHGRVFVDTMHLSMWNSPGSAKLNDLAKDLLDDCKDDVKYTEINALQDGDKRTRQRLAQYCAKDTWITYALSRKMDGLKQLAELSKKHRIVLSTLLTKMPKQFELRAAFANPNYHATGHLKLEEAQAH